MTMATGPQGSVFGLASWVMLDGGAGPVIESVAQTQMGGAAHKNDLALTGPLGNGSCATQTSQSVIVSVAQSFSGFCEQRGEDGPSHSRQGSQDRHVALLTDLPLSCLPCVCEFLGEAVDIRLSAWPIW